jgi:hypothetical protein
LTAKKALLTVVTIGGGSLLALVLVVPMVEPWSPVNCWHESMDITAGRYRYQRYLLWLKLADRIDETPLSRRYRDLIGEPPEPVWRRVNTFSLGTHHSPHYTYHGSFADANTLETALNLPVLTDEARAAAIETFFKRLQSDDSYFEASRYANRVLRVAVEAWDTNRVIRPGDLPRDEAPESKQRETK